jgi:hypothetical protein
VAAKKVRVAAIATKMVQVHLDRALELLEAHARINALGVLRRPRPRRAALLGAAAQIISAAELIGRTEWPTASDYANERLRPLRRLPA